MSSYFIWIMFIGMLLMMWFVSRRQRAMQEEQKRRTEKGLVPGNWVRTIGGFYGTVVEVDGDVVTLATPLGDETLWSKRARAAILHTHLRERPVEGIDLQALARAAEGLTGADLSHVCDSAAENALMDSVRTGRPRLMNMKDMYAALKEVRPSSGPWFETARAVVEYADVSGEYAELREWMKRHRIL